MRPLTHHPSDLDGRNLTAVLGPTNTGKTWFAIERLLSHSSGMIGLPLRLLAREVYDKLVARRSPHEVALVTGEEKIIPRDPRYWVATVEAMPLEIEVAFVAIDEIQLAADLERGRIFTSRLLHARGLRETLFLGSDTMRPILKSLFPEIGFTSRDRLSVLSYGGPKKVTRLPRRSAIVAFSADTVYAVAELIRRQRGGAAVVLGALSPRTRNAQAELYQSGDVEYLVATDAIGMGLNMDINHVAFAAKRKFDGRGPRLLRHDELAQVAGRAGRHMRDGTFGVTADCTPFDEDTIEAIETHHFAPVRHLQWRSEALDFGSLPALQNSLNLMPHQPHMVRARPGDDEEVLARLVRNRDVRERAIGGAALKILWETCQIPDFRKVAIDEHARIAAEIYEQLIDQGTIADTWLGPRVERLDRTDGDIDALSARIAHVRTWTYLSNRSGWLDKASYWQEKTRRIEDSLSDALHEKLTQRFVDRRTSVLFKKLKDDTPILAGVTDDGDVIVEGQFVGRLIGFEFIIDASAKGVEAKRVRAAADRALTPVLASRAAALATAKSEELTQRDDGTICWRASPIAHLAKGPTPLRPKLVIRGLDRISPSLRGRIQDRIQDYFASRVEALLGPLILLGQAAEAGEKPDDKTALNAAARGVAYRLVENFGAMSRVHFGDELKKLPQDERAKLRKLGMRFGEYTLFMPALLKPSPAKLLTLLWALWTDRQPADFMPPKAGLVSMTVIEDLPHAYYYASGYRPSGNRAVRIDMLERLAGQIRADRKDSRQGFEATSQMMSLVGCSGEEFEGILKSLGYKKTMVKRPAKVAEETSPAAQKQTRPVAPANDGASQTPAETSPDETGSDAAITAPVEPATDTPTEPPKAPSDVPVAAATPSEPSAPSDGGDAQTPPQPDGDENPAPIANDNSVAPSDTPPAPQDGAPADTQPQDAAAATNGDASNPAPSEPAEIEVALWRYVPRRPPVKNTPARANTKGKGKFADKAKNKKTGNPGQRSNSAPRTNSPYVGKPKNLPKKGAEGHAPRHRKVADPDSPFAVLAGLTTKDDNSSDKS